MFFRSPKYHEQKGIKLFVVLLKGHFLWYLPLLMMINLVFYFSDIPLRINENIVNEPINKVLTFTLFVSIFFLLATGLSYCLVLLEKNKKNRSL